MSADLAKQSIAVQGSPSPSSVIVTHLVTQQPTGNHPEVVETPDLKLARDNDVAAASWTKPRLSRAFGAVIRQVPQGYPAYARICYPVEDDVGQHVT